MKQHFATSLIDEFRDDDFYRVPGLFRLWEIQHLLRVGVDFRLEEAGETAGGAPLFVLFERETKVRDTSDEEH